MQLMFKGDPHFVDSSLSETVDSDVSTVKMQELSDTRTKIKAYFLNLNHSILTFYTVKNINGL